MAEFYKKHTGSSGVAKAGLALGATAAGVTLLNGGLGGIIGGGFRTPLAAVSPVASPYIPAPVTFGGVPSDAFYVTEKEMCLQRQLNSSESDNARLRAEKYADNVVRVELAPVYAELKKQGDDICDLKAGLAMESERRSCGDENLFTYVNGNFIKAEKSINSRDINYHGIRPVIRLNDCCCKERGGRRNDGGRGEGEGDES